MTKQEIEQRGLRVVPFGKGWHVFGPGVDVLVAYLAALQPGNLKPRRNSVNARNFMTGRGGVEVDSASKETTLRPHSHGLRAKS